MAATGWFCCGGLQNSQTCWLLLLLKTEQNCRPKDLPRVKYELQTTLRTHLGHEDDAFGCMGVGEDAEGQRGVFLRKNVVEVAGRALKRHISALAPRVLPYSELVRRYHNFQNLSSL